MDDEQAACLKELRARRDWPARLDALVIRAAEAGSLCAVEAMVVGEVFGRTARSSQSSATIPAGLVPPSDYSELPNVKAAFYAMLERELRKALGLPVLGGDD
jgi:hypothetical protein